MRRRVFPKVQNDLVDVTPSLPFRRVVALDNWMMSFMKVLGRMAMR